MPKNVFYAQSGGVTAVINTTAAAVIETAQSYPEKIGKVYAGRNGIVGALKNDLIDTSIQTTELLYSLKNNPGGAFGSCRYKLKDYAADPSEYERLIEVFQAYDIGYFFYNGGNDSQDTINKLSRYCQSINFPLQCIGLPKTIDNDLAKTDCCPGFGSVAKFIATTIRECTFDLMSMCATSTQVFIMEVMGRHAGWIAASAGLASNQHCTAPHIILFPEITFNPEKFYQKVHDTIEQHGHCVIVVSEGLKNEAGQFLSDTGTEDVFGHRQLGGVAPMLADLLSRLHGYKCHWAVPDYLQRSARHLTSKTDYEHSYAVGKAAVEKAIAGKSDLMLTINRLCNEPYQWEVGEAKLSEVANVEKMMPRSFIDDEAFHITNAARQYLLPLIQGEVYPQFSNGLPDYRMTSSRNTKTTKAA